MIDRQTNITINKSIYRWSDRSIKMIKLTFEVYIGIFPDSVKQELHWKI